MRGGEVGIELERPLTLADRLVVLARQEETPSPTRVDDERERIELLGSPALEEALLAAPDRHQVLRVPGVSNRIARIELQRPPVFRFRAAPVPIGDHLYGGQRA